MTDVHASNLTSRTCRADGGPIISEVDLDVAAGSITAIIGPSGAGKSTLLDLVTGIQVPRAGTVQLGPASMHPARSVRRARLRARTIATARQTDDLIDALSVSDNVLLGQRLARRVDRPRREATLHAIGFDRAMWGAPVRALSGGERRRVAVARALSSGNPIIVADEPTGALDEPTARNVGALLRQSADLGRTVVVATHDAALAAIADRVVLLTDGSVTSVLHHASPVETHALMNRVTG